MSNPLHGIEMSRVEAEYQARALDTLSDAELVAHTGELISRPARHTTSFSLHAPLELLARSALLPAVAESRRRLARLQVVALAARYQTIAELQPSPPPFTGSIADAVRELEAAIRAGDVERTDAIAGFFATSTRVHEALPAIADLVLGYLGSAAHAPILLMLVARAGAAVDSLPLLAGAVSGLAMAPAERVAARLDDAAPGAAVGGDEVRDVFFNLLVSARRNAFVGWGISPLVQHVESQGIVAESLEAVRGMDGLDDEHWDHASRGCCAARPA